jgi:hypothetical protein
MSGFLPASIFFLLLLRTVSSQTVSIQYVSAYTSQRDCAFACQGINPDDADVIAESISCDTEPLENSCFCRSDLQAKAENHISTCVQSMCGDTEDATSAVSIYEAYCTSAGFQAVGNTRMSGQLLHSLLLRLSWWQAMVEIVTVRLHRGGRGVQLGFWWNLLFFA